MPGCQLDHIVFAARSLEAGVAYLEDVLGVTVPAGGAHPLMGTHNCLMQIGNGAFLEIIAIGPDAPEPSRPRWFSLDDPKVRERIAECPALLTWVVRTDDICAASAAAPISPGPVEEGKRGDLVWQITLLEDGSMPEGGLFPTLIQWPGSLGPDGPAPGMSDLGCRLDALKIYHREPERLTTALTAIGAEHLVEIRQSDETSPPVLAAVINTPKGKIVIS